MKPLAALLLMAASLVAQYSPPSGGAAGPAGPAGPVGPAGPAGSDGAPGVPGYSPNSIISGGQVAWNGGLTFTASATIYLIGQTQYTAAQTNITLSTADPTNPRIDAIVGNSSGAIVAVAGTPAATPAPPSLDPASQIGLTFILVPANGTAPSGASSTLVYDENAGPSTEWTCTKSGTPIALASTSNPYHLTKDIEATAAVNGNYAQCAAAAPFNPTTTNYLVLYLRSKSAWPNKKSIQIQPMLSTTNVGSIVSISEGSFGFTTSNTTSYQQIVIPVTLFGQIASMDTLRFTVQGGSSSIGFYLDWITLQSGLPGPTAPTAMTYRGAWNSAVAYSVNDVVTSSGNAYVAITSSTNVAVGTTANWTPLSTATALAWGAITGTLSNQTDLQTALNLKAALASPSLTGSPTAPTQSSGDNSTKIATTAYVDAVSVQAVPLLIDSVNGASVGSTRTATASYTAHTGTTIWGFCSFTAFTGSGLPTAGALSDGGTNTYVVKDNYVSASDIGGGGQRYPGYYLFAKANVTAGAFTYTCTLTPTASENYNMQLSIIEWNSHLSATLDGTAVHVTQAAAQGIDFGTLTTTNANDLIVSVYGLPASGSNGACIPATNLSMVAGSSLLTGTPYGIMARYVTSAGAKHTSCIFPSVTNTAIGGLLAFQAQ